MDPELHLRLYRQAERELERRLAHRLTAASRTPSPTRARREPALATLVARLTALMPAPVSAGPALACCPA